jgi:gamma-glutamyltranspeptidase/glutathione hydrolase
MLDRWFSGKTEFMRRWFNAASSSLLAVALLASAVAAPAALADPATAPRPAPTLAKHAMVAAANPLAAAAGLKVLKRGGNVIDAAIAVQAVLGLVEPQSSSLAGGTYFIYYDGKTHTVTSYDGRETAPKSAGPDLFIGPDGKPMGYFAAILSGKSTGAPGAMAALALAHHDHGVLPWNSLFGDAEKLASDGFVVSPRLAGMIVSRAPQTKAPDIVAYFSKPDGARYVAGDVLKNPAYAATVHRVATEGLSALYKGSIPADIVARLRRETIPGQLTVEDIAGYKPRSAPGICRPYRVYTICVPQDPSGGSALLEAVGILAHTDINKRGPNDAQAWFEFAQASRLAYADRDRYVGDPAFVKVPTEGLLDPAYLAERAKLIGETAGPAPTFGTPKGAPVRARDMTPEPGGTSHIVIVDDKGNALSMTTTVESIFGSGHMVDGMMLNNQLTDFSLDPKNRDGTLAANAPAGGKRPRSSMAPVIVLDRQGKLVAAFGSPGGPAIIAFNLKALVAVLDWKMPMQDALALPNLIAHGGSFVGEVGKFSPAIVAALAAKGVHITSGFGEDSGLQGILVRKGGLEGGADPRREGVALGF